MCLFIAASVAILDSHWQKLTSSEKHWRYASTLELSCKPDEHSRSNKSGLHKMLDVERHP